MTGIKGVRPGTLALAGGGSLLLWSGLTGKKWTVVLRDVIAGKNPSTAGTNSIAGTQLPASTVAGITTTNPFTGNTGIVSGSAAANKAMGMLMAAPYGWSTGAEWTALNNLVMSESGWNASAANPSSNARGIAQNINGWSASYQQGNAPQQIAWLLKYIKSRYGDPIKAWNFHLANNWY